MAPRGRGSGGGVDVGGASRSSSSSTCGYAGSGSYPCTTQFRNLYVYSTAEYYGQLITYVIYSAALITFLALIFKYKVRRVQIAIASFLISFIFLCVRYGLLIADNDILVGYRFESSIVVLLQRVGMVILFAAAFLEFTPTAGMFTKAALWLTLAIYAALNVTYIILDFVVSAATFSNFKEEWHWRYSDRDFGLVYTKEQIRMIKVNRGNTNITLSPGYVQSLVLDLLAEDDYADNRSIQVKVGVAADVFAIVVVLVLAAIAVLAWHRRSKVMGPLSSFLWPIVAIFGLLLSTVFRLIISAYYILWNWKVVTDVLRWNDFLDQYDTRNSPFTIIAAPGFLEGYRTTVANFPIVQAVIEPLGIVLACAALAMMARSRWSRLAAVAVHQPAPPPPPGH